MAIAYQGATTGKVETLGTGLTFSHTVSSGSDLYLARLQAA